MKRKYLIFTFILILFIVAWGVSYSWTFTPHGRLDYRAAVSLNLLSFTRVYQPDPESDFEVELPVNLAYALSAALPRDEVSRVEDVIIPGNGVDIPARVYWPAALDKMGSPPPVIVYFHGGGFVVGSVDIFDGLTRSLSNAAEAIVISVDYRLAPGAPYPAPLEDCYSALQWAAANASDLGGDPDNLVVAGDSAGGNLAAVVALKAKEEAGPALAAQVLYYPAVDLTDAEYGTEQRFSDGYGLSEKSSSAFTRAYAGHVEDRSEPYISPLYAEDLAGLPPALVVTAGFDPLTGEAQAYVGKLKESGVAVTARHYPTMIHGFMSVDLFSQREAGLKDTNRFLSTTIRSE